MFSLSEYIYLFYLIFFYIRRAISTQTNPKSVLAKKKTSHMQTNVQFLFSQSKKNLGIFEIDDWKFKTKLAQHYAPKTLESWIFIHELWNYEISTDNCHWHFRLPKKKKRRKKCTFHSHLWFFGSKRCS